MGCGASTTPYFLPAAGAVQLRNELSSSFGLALPPTITFDYPTPAALAAFIATQISGSEERAPQEVAAVPSALALPPAPAPALSEVVGLGCAFPGPAAAAGMEGFWAAAAAGSDLPTVIPLDRWAVEQHYAPDVTGGWCVTWSHAGVWFVVSCPLHLSLMVAARPSHLQRARWLCALQASSLMLTCSTHSCSGGVLGPDALRPAQVHGSPPRMQRLPAPAAACAGCPLARLPFWTRSAASCLTNRTWRCQRQEGEPASRCRATLECELSTRASGADFGRRCVRCVPSSGHARPEVSLAHRSSPALWPPPSPPSSYVGVMHHEFVQALSSQGVSVGPGVVSGSGADFLVGRLSYTFGFQGPCIRCAAG